MCVHCVMDLADLRTDYDDTPLREEDLLDDPMAQLRRWLEDAHAGGIPEPNAMSLTTIGPDGAPGTRMVLLRSLERDTAVFYTNLESRKALDLAADPRCALLFWWPPLHRQVRLEGRAVPVPREQAAAYFATRSRASQIGAWASPQSRALADRSVLEARFHEAEDRFAGQEVPLPPSWGGFAVTPQVFEFWQGRASRLHDRFLYEREGRGWRRVRLAP